jgi:hypothetical protein
VNEQRGQPYILQLQPAAGTRSDKESPFFDLSTTHCSPLTIHYPLLTAYRFSPSLTACLASFLRAAQITL